MESTGPGQAPGARKSMRAWLARRVFSAYNDAVRVTQSVPRTRQLLMTLTVAILSLGLLGASCKKDAEQPTADENPQVDEAAKAAKAVEHKGDESDNTPIPALDLSKLEDEDKARFDKLVNTLASPCGDARSLRKAAAGEGDCKRAAFAARFVVELLVDGGSDVDVRELYGMAYRNLDKKVGFKLSDDVPHTGPSDARVVFVEFYDYGCPACRQFKPLMDKIAEEFPQDVVIYYKQFPLSGHPDSDEAAAAALAAHAQGKFKEMHALLFENPFKHKMGDLRAHAKSAGLDMAKFESDFKASVAKVAADKAEGSSHVQGTPTLFLNGRLYEGPAAPKYLKLFVEEELAVNQ